MQNEQAIWNYHFNWCFETQAEADAFLEFWKIDKKEVNFGYLYMPEPVPMTKKRQEEIDEINKLVYKKVGERGPYNIFEFMRTAINIDLSGGRGANSLSNLEWVERVSKPYKPELKVDNKPLVELPIQHIWLEAINSNLGGQRVGYYFCGTLMQASKRKRLWESATTISELIKLTQE